MAGTGVTAAAALPAAGVPSLFVLLLVTALAGGGRLIAARLRRVVWLRRVAQPCRPAQPASAAGEQAGDRGVDVQVLGLPATRHRDVCAPQEADQHAARYLEQRVAVRRGQGERDE